MKKQGDKKPEVVRLGQHRPHRRVRALGLHGLAHIGHQPDAEVHRQQGHPGPGRKVLHAMAFKPGAGQEDRDQKADRAPKANAAIAPGVERAVLADQVRHGGLAHGHHGAGVGEHQQQHHRQPGQATLPTQSQRAQQGHARTPAQQPDALAGVVAQPAPGIRRKQPRERLQGHQQANDPDRQPQLFEPERQIGVEETDVGKVAGRQGRKRHQLATRGTSRGVGHGIRPVPGRRSGPGRSERRRIEPGGATHGPSPPAPAAPRRWAWPGCPRRDRGGLW